MYYRERVIDGVLCYQTDPKGNWTPFTVEQLTERLVETKRLISELRNDIENEQRTNV